jgi:hypothetical protein
MSKELRTTFLIHAVTSVIFGALLFFIPGRFLEWIKWAPIDPIASRVLGAAFLALAWSSYRGSRAQSWAQVALLVELEAAVTVLACIGLARHLFFWRYPVWPWIFFAIFAIFAVAWVVLWLRERD